MKSSKQPSKHCARNRSGFTLVELLVVIAIIGVLVAITIPAIGGAREAARRNQCLANQRSWGQAMQQHDSAKQYLPGRVTQIRNNSGDFINISWMHKLLPYMDQQNVYDALLLPTSYPYLDISQAPQKWSDVNDPNKAVPLVTLEPAICPSGRTVAGGLRGESNFVMNSGMSDASAAGATRYDPNLNVTFNTFQQNAFQSYDKAANGIGHLMKGSQGQKVSASSIKDGAVTTLLISENLNALTWFTTEESLSGFVWEELGWAAKGTQPTDHQTHRINVGADELTDLVTLTSMNSLNLGKAQQWAKYARPSSNHSGGVNAIFADGHGQFLSEDIDPTVYARLLTTDGTQASHLGENPQDQVYLYQQVPLSTSDIDP